MEMRVFRKCFKDSTDYQCFVRSNIQVDSLSDNIFFLTNHIGYFLRYHHMHRP